MLVEEARSKAKKIRRLYALGDFGASHSIEDQLMRDTIKMVCNEDPDFLLVSKITFEVVSEARDRYFA